MSLVGLAHGKSAGQVPTYAALANRGKGTRHWVCRGLDAGPPVLGWSFAVSEYLSRTGSGSFLHTLADLYYACPEFICAGLTRA